jgi:hypothetical protein
MKEYLRTDGEELSITYTAPAGTDSVVYTITDLDFNEVLFADEATLISGVNFSIDIPSDITAYDRKLQIDLQIVDAGSYSEDILFASLVRPYCNIDELASELGLTISSTPTGSGQIKRSDLERLEKRARFLINKITNDKFNFEYKSILTYGQNADTLYIGERIETYDKIVKDDEIVYDVTADPEINLLDYPVSVSKSKYHLKVYDVGTNVSESTPFRILDPYGVFEKNSTYLVRGEFGWKYVPEDIREAAILIVEDLRCADFNYRNKGLKSVKNESFDIQYSDSISLGSGNLLVDSFLQDYKRFDLMVI